MAGKTTENDRGHWAMNCTGIQPEPRRTVGFGEGSTYVSSHFPLADDGGLVLKIRFPSLMGFRLDGEPAPRLLEGLVQPDDGCGWKFVISAPPGEEEQEYPLWHGKGFRIDGDRDVEVQWHVEPMRWTTQATLCLVGPCPQPEGCA